MNDKRKAEAKVVKNNDDDDEARTEGIFEEELQDEGGRSARGAPARSGPPGKRTQLKTKKPG